jgi:hypothetical protein
MNIFIRLGEIFTFLAGKRSVCCAFSNSCVILRNAKKHYDGFHCKAYYDDWPMCIVIAVENFCDLWMTSSFRTCVEFCWLIDFTA